jgi:mannose/fructose/N-acetylgalactosamine-specific phosphotransferase system component IIC
MNTFKKVTALAIVILWILLILTTLIVAFINTETARTLLKGLIVIDICLPVVGYAIRLMAHLLSKK